MTRFRIISTAIALSFLVQGSANAAPHHHPARRHRPVRVAVHRSVHHGGDAIVSPYLRQAWQRVAVCEEGGDWKHWTWWYPDALGIDRPNFIQFGGNPNRVNSFTQQILVGQRFVAYYRMAIPDQNGCGPY